MLYLPEVQGSRCPANGPPPTIHENICPEAFIKRENILVTPAIIPPQSLHVPDQLSMSSSSLVFKSTNTVTAVLLPLSHFLTPQPLPPLPVMRTPLTGRSMPCSGDNPFVGFAMGATGRPTVSSFTGLAATPSDTKRRKKIRTALSCVSSSRIGKEPPKGLMEKYRYFQI